MYVDKQNHNSGYMHDPAVYQGEIASKGLKRKISLAALWIGVKLHWIWAIQSGSMEGVGTVLIGSIQAKLRVLW